ncbi:MAG TPA: TM1812 family CRISPR-associated protein [Polyangiaceae bacterium LLY-WYZ-15_(1-7)]|nr:TM1812 family CRISPR-associated protein [Polyangiaceae bacterium LLY-WYZ-15_(1-7)]HJL00269.1 TM1812 family CRISPR-associated protein [Polyangiaceae bacterium LLY-WYZ-15_(1-7)]HJL08284.1 TM1812 family CRISPR-associated protein [Polyangiaceae bacterium LLY-WYZ-15_(1-7)]HJL31433.1 TM1812 family CRISPR-associated protein [Polyangiaceae bacterium LLY-WYZ-15_(1-7)]HJL35718.1 TM1812 family CRISPR-associated protein [Polyangiaceae bacterium LLY-WYZ-15_(1-7)]
MTEPHRDHVLVTLLGLAPKHATYTLGDRRADAPLAPVALYELLPAEERPTHAIALCTPEAGETFALFETELPIPVERIEVPTGTDDRDIDAFLHAFTGAFPPGTPVDLTLDLTHGLRHFALLVYTGALYLRALRKGDDAVRIRGAHYGLLADDRRTSRFFDLRPLLELPRWVHALETLDQTGSAKPLSTLLREDPHQSAQRISQELDQLSAAYLSALPLELGRSGHELLCQYRKPLGKHLRGLRVPLTEGLVGTLEQVIEPLRLETGSKDGWKRQVPLTENELIRQGALIDRLLDDGHDTVAFGVLRELVVSWVLWRLPGDTSAWLDRDARSRAEGRLHTLRTLAEQPSEHLSEAQRELGQFWGTLTDVRNGLHHHGMRRQDVLGDQHAKARERVLTYWRETASRFPDIDLGVGGHLGPLLVSPIGMRPGALYSAVHASREALGAPPAHVLVLCSEATRQLADEALDAAAFEGPRTKLELTDPHGGLDELEDFVERARPHLLEASAVHINLTGGTTLMGLLAERLHSAARSLDRPVRRFGLIDPRSAQAQLDDPYHPGRALWLDSPPSTPQQEPPVD